MAADVNAILIAWEGLQEADHEMATYIYGAQGIKMPPLRKAEKADHLTIAAGVRDWARQHNKRFAQDRSVAGARQRAVERAAAKATQKTKSD